MYDSDHNMPKLVGRVDGCNAGAVEDPLGELMKIFHATSLKVEQVGIALDIEEKMCEAGFTLSTEVLQCVLQICEESYEYILVNELVTADVIYSDQLTDAFFSTLDGLMSRPIEIVSLEDFIKSKTCLSS
ncbi:hypothetical protein JHK82_042980 [Glycine max]|nr:hypothetical protein JHK82_042980 [Glycine max]